jgi:SAM-dependent methyltransferase
MADDSFEEMLEHYAVVDEGARLLRSPHGRLEFIRTQSILRRWLPDPPARLLDVGGGTGIHAAWLADDGYQVTLVDPVPSHVEAARHFGTFSCRVGDARKLREADASVDAVLLLGPLYHLVERADRVLALEEAHRVLRPNGVLAAAAISRYLGVLEIGAREDVELEQIRVEADVVRSGHYEPLLGFVTSHWHRPEELVGEVVEAGFRDPRVLGIEGPEWMALDALGIERFEAHAPSALAVAELLESDPAVMATSAHLLSIAFA